MGFSYCSLIFFIIKIVSQLNAVAGTDQYINENERVILNGCDSIYSSKDTIYWNFLTVPDEVELDDIKIERNRDNLGRDYGCLAWFYPIKRGEYIIKLTIKEFSTGEISTDTISINILESSQFKNRGIKLYKDQNIFPFNIIYNKDVKTINKKIDNSSSQIPYYFNIKTGEYLVLTGGDYKNGVIVSSKEKLFIDPTTLYDITLFTFYNDITHFTLYGYQILNNELLIEQTVENILTFNVFNSENIPINGYLSIYLTDSNIYSSKSKLIKFNSPKKIIFTPFKEYKNYPYIIYQGDFSDNIELFYKEIIFYNLDLFLDKNIIKRVKIVSKNIENCINSDNTECFFEKTYITKNKNLELELPKGEYSFIFYDINNRYYSKDIVLNSNSSYTINYQWEDLQYTDIDITTIDNIEYIIFENSSNYFHFKKGEQITIPADIYDVKIGYKNYVANYNFIDITNWDNFINSIENSTFNLILYHTNSYNKLEILRDGIIFLDQNHYINLINSPISITIPLSE